MVRRLLVASLLFAPLLAQADYLITTPDSLLANQADYLVISHQNFTSAMYPLCRLRDSLGLEVKMAELPLVYATFDSGPRTDRIKAFLRQVYYHWTPRPTYVLLVGDACKDSTTGTDFLPCKVFPKFSYSYYGTLTTHSIDNWYAQLEGVDSIPDIIIGRLPVSSLPRCESLTAKIVAYENVPDTGSWVNTAALIWSTDRAQYARQIDTQFLRPMYDSVSRVDEASGNSEQLRAWTRQAFNAGVSLFVQASHGSQPPAWVGSRTLFSHQDVDSLYNRDALPVVLGRG
jgi:hypothetical protein